MIGLLSVLGCVETGVSGPPQGTATLRAPTLTAGRAFDPLYAPVTVTFLGAPNQAVSVVIDRIDLAVDGQTDASGRFSFDWDGTDATGEWVSAGPFELEAIIAGKTLATATTIAVRVGFEAAYFEDDGGVSAVREPLYWPVQRQLQDVGLPFAQLPGIDDGTEPLDFAELPRGPMAMRPLSNEPVAFVHGGRPILTLAVGATGALGEVGLEHVDVDVMVEGWRVLDGNPLQAGGQVLLQRDQPLADTVGVQDEVLELAFMAGDDALGVQALPVRLYRLLDRSQFDAPQDKYRPWAPVVAEALTALEGVPAETTAVLDAMLAYVYLDMGLIYDTNSGASAYSLYAGWDLSEPHFMLSEFLIRRNGPIINCSDAGNIMGAYANMVGARLDHLILDPSFDLNYIRAIGHSEHTRCPFGTWGCGFSYHAVTTNPDSGLIWDATLALDGDANPRELPSTDLLVQQIPASEYWDRLVRSGNPQYNNETQETLE